MQIVETNTEFRITIPFNHFAKRNREAVKKIPNYRWDHINKVWKVPVNQRVHVIKLASMCRAEIIKIQNVQKEVIGVLPPLPKLEKELPIKATLRPYQETGIAQAMKLKRCIIGDEQGLGKTLQSISAVVGVDSFPCLVIAPASTKINWQREWEKFSDKKAIILDNKNKDSWENYYRMGIADVFITNYESLKKFFVSYMPPKGKGKFKSTDIRMKPCINLFKSVIVDESHKCKDTSTQQSKLVLRICQGKEYVFLLTGTAVVNKPIDLFPQLAIMNQHGKFGGRKGFLSRYCEGGSGASNLKELNYKLNLYCFFRREKKDVAKDLPEKQRQTILCDITTRKEYNKAFNEFETYLKSKGCSDRDIAKKMRGEIMVKMGELKRIAAKGKLNEVKEFIHEVTDSGEKIIVFCVLKEIVDALKAEFPKAVSVTGRDNQEQKQQSIDSFQNNPDTKLIICNIKAAGVGITLTASSRVAFIEYPWTYADCVQCEDRAHRIGQKNNVMCTYFLGQRTIDEDLYKMIQSKRQIANTITGATDKMEMSFVDSVLDIFKI